MLSVNIILAPIINYSIYIRIPLSLSFLLFKDYISPGVGSWRSGTWSIASIKVVGGSNGNQWPGFYMIGTSVMKELKNYARVMRNSDHLQ